MAADEKIFSTFRAFLDFYEQKIQDYHCNVGGKDAEKLKDAALALIQGLRAGIPLPGSNEATYLKKFYDDMRNELGLSSKNLRDHVAKSPDHYKLALIARDMFDAILNSEIELAALYKKALESRMGFLKKRRDEIDFLIKNYEGRNNLQNEALEGLYNNSLLILQGRERNIKPDITIADLSKFVAKTEEQVERILLLPDRKPLISEGQAYSTKGSYQITPRARLLNSVLLPDSARSDAVSSSNPFYQFQQAIQNFENGSELEKVEVQKLQERMNSLEAKCKAAAPVALTKAQFCDAYAADEASGRHGGLFPWHQSIEEDLRVKLERYEKSRGGFFTFKRSEKVQQIMKQLKDIHAQMHKECCEIAFRYYGSEKLVTIINHFKDYEQKLRHMQNELVAEFKTLGKAEKEEEYKIINGLYHEVVKFNVEVEQEICAKFRGQIEGLPNIAQIQPVPPIGQIQQASLAQRKLMTK